MASVRAQGTSGWFGTFATAPEYTGAGDMPQLTTLAGHTLRQIVKVSAGGNTIRLQLSNEFSQEPVEIKAVYIAPALDSFLIDRQSAKYITFGGKRSVTIGAKQAVYSDALTYALKPLGRLAVTIIYGERVPEHMTSHRGSRTLSYIAAGEVKPTAKLKPVERLAHWYNLTRIEVKGQGSAVAILGNSITDGRGSTTNAQNRWPDSMAEALSGTLGVLNLGIGGNCVLAGGLSQPGLLRFDRDILGQQGVSTLIIFEGTNDIGLSQGNSEETAQRLIEAYQTLTGKAHARGLKVYLATITPFKGNGWYSFFHEAARQTVNQWIRSQKVADGIIDFDELARDPQKPNCLRAEYSDDWLHLNPTGYEAMGRYAAKVLMKPNK